MPKRFTDTERWDDAWYQDLPSLYQRFWDYICDKCDSAGFWRVNKALADFQLKGPLSLEEALGLFNNGKERIKKLSEGKWFIAGFIKFQYTALKRLDANGKENKVHKPIYSLLESNGVSPSFYESDEIRPSGEGLERPLIRQDKEQVKEKEIKGIVKGKPTLEDLKALFGEKGFPAEAEKFFDYYEANGWRVGRNPMKNWQSAVANWLRNAKSYGGVAVARKERIFTKDKTCTCCGGTGFMLEVPGLKCQFCWK